MTEGAVTLLFTDLVGSTELIDELGDDAGERVRRAHFRLLREAITAGSGQEVKNLGDGLMVAFAGAADAVRCAMAMQAAVARHNARGGAHPLRVRIGLHVGEPIRDEGDYFGTPVVVAKRLCDVAEGGEILVTKLVRDLVGDREALKFRPRGEVPLKGLREPVVTYDVPWEAPDVAAAPLPPVVAARLAPMVGRDAERAVLNAAWERARDGSAELAVIGGEPGIGKTRLAADLAARAHADGAAVLWGACDEEVALPYRPFVEALRQRARDGGPSEISELGDHTIELARLVPELASALDGPSPSADPEMERYRLFEAVAAWLRIPARGGPVLVVLDDLQWSDRPTLLLLRHLLRTLGDVPVLFVGTYRDIDLSRTHPLASALADLRREREVTRVSLRGLSTQETEAYLELLGGERLDEGGREFAALAHRATEGSPFFLAEVTRDLLEAGRIYRKGGRWTSDVSSVEELVIPEGVRAVLGRRLSRLSDDANQVLTVAAVIGAEFSLAVCEEACELPEDRVLDAVDEALAAGLVRDAPDQITVYRFTHALVRETLYRELSAPRRSRLHRRVGEVLERVHASDLGAHLDELAHHFTQAVHGPAVDKALRYLMEAGAHATALLAYEAAAAHYERALQTLDAFEVDDDERTEVLLALGDAHWRAGDHDEAQAAFATAADRARKQDRADQLARAALGLGGTGVAGVWVTVGNVDAPLVQLLEDALARTGDEHPGLKAQMLARLATELYFDASTSERRAQLSKEAVALARTLSDPAPLLAALNSRHWALWNPDDTEQRLAIANELVERAEAAGNREMALTGRTWRIVDLLELGDIETVDREIDAHAAAADELRQPAYQWRSKCFQAMRATFRGEFEAGEALAVEALGIGDRVTGANAMQQFGSQLFVLRAEQGRLGELEPLLEGFAEAQRAIPGWRASLAAVYSRLGRIDEARRELEAITPDGRPQLPFDGQWMTGVALLADACHTVGDPDRARHLYDLLLPYTHRVVVAGFGLACSGVAARHVGLMALTMGDDDAAVTHLDTALTENTRLGARPWVAHTQHDLARALRQRGGPGDAERAATLLAESLATADALGMVRLREWVGELLG